MPLSDPVPMPDEIVRWQIGAVDQLGRLVIIEGRFAYDAKLIAQRWLSAHGLPNELGLGQLVRHNSNGRRNGAGLLVVRDNDGELEERTLTDLEVTQ